ncbi:cytochrome c oxidase assembly protein [Cellulomonas sp. C5510]|uniref:cytochrome c oxidase assembly protein n=1 Tax=Cellulomonas sp. C5510 TaxID=2871170 RepID=UPI00210844AF|nr:cytochrome c oxidase assembly protein [Cellulomonas sp. C5510]
MVGALRLDVSGPAWLPPEPASLASLLAPTLQPVPLLPAVGLVLAILYTAGVIRMRASGRRWSPWATLSFLTGCVLLVVVTGAGIEGYGLEMFSVFMFQQLTLMVTIPPLLVLGRPGTLLLHATPHGRVGRRVLATARWGLRGGLGAFLLHPALAVPLFLLAFYGLYLSQLAGNLLSTWAGHIGLETAFLVAGVLFITPVLSRDPLPRKQGHAMKAVDVFLEMAVHAFFGVIVMMATTPLVQAFTHPPAAWGVDVMADQWLAGGLAWSYGELPTLLILLLVFARWNRDESRTTAAEDRRIDRFGNPELDAYNAYLRTLNREP